MKTLHQYILIILISLVICIEEGGDIIMNEYTEIKPLKKTNNYILKDANSIEGNIKVELILSHPSQFSVEFFIKENEKEKEKEEEEKKEEEKEEEKKEEEKKEEDKKEEEKKEEEKKEEEKE